MKKTYKIAVVVAVTVCLLLCCCVGVFATSDKMTWCTDPRNQFVRSYWTNYAGGELTTAQTVNVSFSASGNVLLGVTVPKFDYGDPVRFHAIFTTADTFLYPINPDKYYTFLFTLGQASDHAVVDKVELDIVSMVMTDSEGNSIQSEAEAVAIDPDVSKNQWTKVSFEPSQISRLQNISTLEFVFEFEQKLDTATQFSALMFPYATVTVTDPTLDAIQGFIQESTDQITGEIQDSTDKITGSIEDSTDEITNGWESNPERPEGSNSVDDMTSVEDEIIENSQEGIDQGNQVLTDFGGLLANWEEGFIFVIGLFTRLFENTWINSLIQIGLALGVVAFILNIAPAVARKITGGKKGG